nr:MAG TPA: hypothetical protein [Caudoviricetes sp.]
MVPMECRDPKRTKSILIDIEKRAEINPSRSLEEAIQLAIQGLSMKHEATDGLPSWYFTKRKGTQLIVSLWFLFNKNQPLTGYGA